MKKKNIIIGAVVIIAIIVGLVLFRISGQVTMYSDERTVGNTSCNLLNGGLVCQVEDTIYFSNPYDEGNIYKMDSDLSHMKRLVNDNASYINGAGKYLFYTKRNDQKTIDSDSFMAMRSTGLYRVNAKTKNISCIYTEPTQVATLYGNYVYYQHYDQKKGLELYSEKIDGTEEKMLLPEACAPYVITDSSIYYTSLPSSKAVKNGEARADHSIRRISIHGGEPETVFDGNLTGLSRQGNYLYFLDMSDNYSLKRIPIEGGQPETLVSDRIATYNVSENGDVLYCQIDNQKNNGLYELNISTHNLKEIKSGNFNYLHLTSDYLFYETYDQSEMYVMELATGKHSKLPYKE